MKKLLTLLSICILTLSCQKDSVEIIPNVRFTAEINLDNPQYSGSNPFIVLPGGTNQHVGIKGVVVYELSRSDYYAFDLMCTHQHEKTTPYFVQIVKPGDIVLKCPECGSEYNVAVEYGSVVKGPAKWPLKRYQTSVSNNILRIWN
ncbi:Rieske 2Fe-2S domain-containing protein [Carboxylicivirga sediminis]|uniref:Rieske 2Fe-2S domain-containing protein n=1 Tax=Carboxylicivirga sediminis TaxID=2006564 RepID=A0A941F786_9BACT|nr:Rieske 2Fe-2S domain-containing protein [Carboxylicivirga sediminis]MBR8536585.1 Rieske 2Fe-2S domain-containing protein [Carboxylicivirga sediminis]